MSGWYGILAPAATPEDRIDTLNKAVRAVLRRPEVKSRLLAVGIEPVDSSPDDLRQFIAADVKKWAKVIKAINLPPQ